MRYITRFISRVCRNADRRSFEDFGTFKLGGKVIRFGKYADDLVLIAVSEEESQEMIDRLVEVCRR